MCIADEPPKSPGCWMASREASTKAPGEVPPPAGSCFTAPVVRPVEARSAEEGRPPLGVHGLQVGFTWWHQASGIAPSEAPVGGSKAESHRMLSDGLALDLLRESRCRPASRGASQGPAAAPGAAASSFSRASSPLGAGFATSSTSSRPHGEWFRPTVRASSRTRLSSSSNSSAQAAKGSPYSSSLAGATAKATPRASRPCSTTPCSSTARRSPSQRAATPSRGGVFCEAHCAALGLSHSSTSSSNSNSSNLATARAAARFASRCLEGTPIYAPCARRATAASAPKPRRQESTDLISILHHLARKVGQSGDDLATELGSMASCAQFFTQLQHSLAVSAGGNTEPHLLLMEAHFSNPPPAPSAADLRTPRSKRTQSPAASVERLPGRRPVSRKLLSDSAEPSPALSVATTCTSTPCRSTPLDSPRTGGSATPVRCASPPRPLQPHLGTLSSHVTATVEELCNLSQRCRTAMDQTDHFLRTASIPTRCYELAAGSTSQCPACREEDARLTQLLQRSFNERFESNRRILEDLQASNKKVRALQKTLQAAAGLQQQQQQQTQTQTQA